MASRSVIVWLGVSLFSAGSALQSSSSNRSRRRPTDKKQRNLLATEQALADVNTSETEAPGLKDLYAPPGSSPEVESATSSGASDTGLYAPPKADAVVGDADVSADLSTRPPNLPNLTPTNLSESMLTEFSSRSDRNLEVARLQSALERSQLRRQQVEEVIAEELAALRQQLESELEAEQAREMAAATLMAQLESASTTKRETCAREERLLIQLQDVAQRTTEDKVRVSLEGAIEVKAKLVAIELLLIEDIIECQEQISVELSEIEGRREAIKTTRASLPGLDDREATRQYTWAQVASLQEELADTAQAIAKTDAKVAALRERITDALESREGVLGQGPLGRLGQQEQTEPTKQINLDTLDDEALTKAMRSSFENTFDAWSTFTRSCSASVGNYAESDERARATMLLGEATSSGAVVRKSLSEASQRLSLAEKEQKPLDGKYSTQVDGLKISRVSTAALEGKSRFGVHAEPTLALQSVFETTLLTKAQVATITAKSLGTSLTKVGAALVEAGGGLRVAAGQADLGGAAAELAAAMGTTLSAGTILALRAAKAAALKMQNI